MKNNLSFLPLLMLGIILTFSACQKDDPEPEPEVEAQQTDQSGSAAVDGALDDINDIINNKIGGGSNQKVAAYNLPCGIVSVDSNTTNTYGKKIYKVKYGSQTACGYKKKSGDISFQLLNGDTFRDTGAVFQITFTNYKVEVQATGDIVTVNGTVSVTNVDGGYVWETVVAGRTVVHRLRGTFDITYANGEVRERNYYQLRTWSSNNSWAGLTLTVAGDTLINSVKVSETGKTYEGNYDFKTEVLQDLTWSNCGTSYAGPYVLKSGQARMNVTVPGVTPAYFDVEAGYKANLADLNATPTLTNDCESNAYKITIVLGTFTSTQYQLY